MDLEPTGTTKVVVLPLPPAGYVTLGQLPPLSEPQRLQVVILLPHTQSGLPSALASTGS